MESKAILYHSNKKYKCKKFISQSDYLIVSENDKDDIWLGKGMYFWDNKGNVKWWNNKQMKKHPKGSFAIMVANVNLEHLLDLTDIEIYKKLEEVWNAVCKIANLDSDRPLGNKLDYLFDIENYSIPAQQTTVAPVADIGVEKAKEIALAHAGVGSARFTKAKIDYENGIKVYEIEFKVGNMEYEYDINVSNGAIISSSAEIDD